ncbi:Thioredoxin-like protein 4A [Chionoecetes opilio]|uniref:Thioredoxin-like protein 4A n=1 Tax=Chionoecetes opilio TaxID=41210 RepID=A0A8J4YF81_CHIOP|nr:Thioredoxin-like protein 4A [Chionoecetes opilio]
MSYMLQHLHNGWQVDQAILSEEDRVVCQRFHSPCMSATLSTPHPERRRRLAPPSRQHAVIPLTCAFLRKTGQLQRLLIAS